MGIAAFIPFIGPLFKIIDKVVDNKEEADKIKAAIQAQALNNKAVEFEAAAKIVLGEINGESWLQRNWRPMLMLWFAGLVGAHWLGFTAPNLSDDVVLKLLSIVQIGIAGYLIGRSGEKITKIAVPALEAKYND